MFGKKLLTLSLIGLLLVQMTTVVYTQEADNKVLLFTAQPVDTGQFRKEWKNHAWVYAIIWSLAYGMVLLK